MIRKIAILVGQVILASALIVSSMIHLAEPYIFLESVLNYRILSGITGWLAAAFLMHFGLIAGFAIISGMFRPQIYVLTTLLFVLFAIAQFSAWGRGLEISCGCFGSTDQPIGETSIGIAIALLLCSVLMFYTDRPNKPVARTLVENSASKIANTNPSLQESTLEIRF